MNKRTLQGAGIVILLLILVVVVLLWQRPSRVVDTAIQNLAAAASQSIHATVKVENAETTQQLLGEQATVEIKVDGSFQRIPDDRDAIDAKVAITTQTESISVLIEADTRFVGDKAYIRITKSPPTFPALVQLKDIWLELPRGGQQEETNLLGDEPLFVGVKRAGTQEVNGQTVRTFEADATSAAVISMLDSIANVLGTSLTDDQVAGIRTGMEQVESVPVELGINTRQREIRQIKTNLDIPNSNSLDITLILSDRNKDVTIEPPEGARTVEDILSTATSTVPAPAQEP